MTSEQNGDERANFGSTAPSQPGSTSQSSEIRDMLCEFHTKLSDKIETSQNSMRENFEHSQRNMRESMINEFKGLMTTEVLNPLKTSINEANDKITRLEQDHQSKIAENARNIENAKEQLQQQIAALENRLTISTAPESQSRHSFNPSLLSRLNNIIISGIKEENDEDLKRKVQEIANALDCQIDSIKAKRLGKKNESTPRPRPRQVLVQLGSHWDRKKLYAARSKLNGFENTEGQKPYEKVFFNEDLDKPQASLFYKGRQAKKEGLIKSIWTYGCQVYFAKHGSEVPIALTAESQLPRLPAQAQNIAAARITTAPPGNPSSAVTEVNTERPPAEEQISGQPANQ